MGEGTHDHHDHEDLMIVISDRVEDPDAVVVKTHDAIVGDGIMLATHRFADETR